MNKAKMEIKSDKLEFNTYYTFTKEKQDENKFLSKSLISTRIICGLAIQNEL